MLLAATADALEQAAALLRAGEVVAFPTETVYGLGAVATDARAVAKVFAIKARPAFDPLIVHLADTAQLDCVATAVPQSARRLVARYWPGPLTVVLPKQTRIPDIVTAGLPSLAVRVPDHPVARDLIVRTAKPIAAPSANPFGYISPTSAQHVVDQLGDAVGLVLDGGSCRVGLESTIVSFLEPIPVLLRPGAITHEMLERELGPVALRTDSSMSIAPGQLPRHYAPRTAVRIVADPSVVPAAERADSALLACTPVADTAGFAAVEILAPDADLEAAAARLFAALRALDAAAHRRVFVVAVPEHGIGRAIMDRLRRAAVGLHARASG